MLKNILNADDVARLQGMGKSASVHLREALVNTAETAWTAGANVVTAQESTLFKRGTYSSKATLGAAITGTIAYQALAAAYAAYNAALAGITHIGAAVRSDHALAAGTMQFGLDNSATYNSAEGAGKELFDWPALPAANAWYWLTLAISAAKLANLTHLDSVGLTGVAAHNGAVIYVDHVRLLKLDTHGAEIAPAQIHAVGNDNGDVGVVDVFNLPLKSRELVVFSLPCDALVIPYVGGITGWSSDDVEGGAMDYLSGQSDGPTPFIATSMAVQRADNLVGGVSATGERIALRVVE